MSAIVTFKKLVGLSLLLTSGSLALSALAAPVAPTSCESGKVQVQVLGSGGPELNDKRASTSYLIWIDHHARILVDFGSGAALNYEKSGAKPEDLQAVLLSHFHVDHTADFPALVKGLGFTKFDDEIQVFGPARSGLFPGLNEFLGTLFNSKTGTYAYLGQYLDPDQGSQFKITANEVAATNKQDKQDKQDRQVVMFALNDETTLKTISVPHGPVPSLAWRVEAHGCAITFSGDTSNADKTLEILADGSDLLIAHNAAQENEPDRVARLLHMMPSEIGRIASTAKVKKLVLSHRMLRTLGKEKQTSAAIKQSFNGPIQFADDLQIFPVGAKAK